MNRSVFCDGGGVAVLCERIHGFAFGRSVLGVKSALLPILSDGSASLRDYCTHLRRMECLSPHRYSPA